MYRPLTSRRLLALSVGCHMMNTSACPKSTCPTTSWQKISLPSPIRALSHSGNLPYTHNDNRGCDEYNDNENDNNKIAGNLFLLTRPALEFDPCRFLESGPKRVDIDVIEFVDQLIHVGWRPRCFAPQCLPHRTSCQPQPPVDSYGDSSPGPAARLGAPRAGRPVSGRLAE